MLVVGAVNIELIPASQQAVRVVRIERHPAMDRVRLGAVRDHVQAALSLGHDKLLDYLPVVFLRDAPLAHLGGLRFIPRLAFP